MYVSKRTYKGRQTSNLYTIFYAVKDRVTIKLDKLIKSNKSNKSKNKSYDTASKVTLCHLKEIWDWETKGVLRGAPLVITRPSWLMKQFKKHMNGDIQTFKRYIRRLMSNNYCINNGSNIGMLTALSDKMVERYIDNDILEPKEYVPDNEQKQLWIDDGRHIKDSQWRDVRSTLIIRSTIFEWKNWLSHLVFKHIDKDIVAFNINNQFIARELSDTNKIYRHMIVDACNANGLNIKDISLEVL
jgi:hypothetical protein